MYVALLYGSRLCKKSCIVFFAIAAKHTNKLPLPWQDMKDAYLCLSLHTVYPEITCCLRDQTCLFHRIISGQSHMTLRLHDYVIWFFFEILKFFEIWNLQLWVTFLSSSIVKLLPVGEKVHSRTRHHFCVYLSCFLWVEKWAKTRFWITLFCPTSVRYTENVFGLCIIYCLCLLLVHNWFWNKQSCHHPVLWT